MPDSDEYVLKAEGEIDRLKIQHDGIKALMPSLIVPPLDVTKKGLRILDSGTADGYWLRDLRHAFPADSDVTLIGTDIMGDQFPPESSRGTCQLQLQSILEPWPTSWHASFDLVHQRLVMGACGAHPMLDVVRNLAALVKPGGWIQLIEPEQVSGLTDGPAMAEFIALVDDVFAGLGGDIRYSTRLAGYLREAGMMQVQERGLPYFLGSGPNVPAHMAHMSAVASADAMAPLIGFAAKRNLKTSLSKEALETLADRLKEELIAQGGYYPLRVVWAQKPL